MTPGTNLMDSAWIGAISALGGVVVGAAAETLRSHWSFRREKKWAVIEESRRRLEMIYEALEQFSESYGIAVAQIMRAVQSGEPPAMNSDGQKVPWAKLRMLVHLYAPDLLPVLEPVEVAGRELGGAMGAAIVYQVGDPERDRPYIDDMFGKLEKLSAAADAMRRSIVHSSGRLDEHVSSLLGTGAGEA